MLLEIKDVFKMGSLRKKKLLWESLKMCFIDFDYTFQNKL